MADNTFPQLAVIGLDGGTWALLKPLVDAGYLKCLGSLMSRGARAPLQSIIPPVTGPAWPVLATGLNPGRLGTYDFYNRQSLESFDLHPVRSHQLRGRAFWDVLSARGYRAGVFNYPMLVPAYELNGWMVAGLGASKMQDWTWPDALGKTLDEIARPYVISLSYNLPKYRDNRDLLLNDLEAMFSARLAALKYLLKESPVDVLVAVFGITDILSHTMWHLWDSNHPEYDEQLASRLLPRVHMLLSRLDSEIEELIHLLPPTGNLLIVSDHGFGPSYGVFHINTWLEQQGYLKRSDGPASHLSNRLRAALVSKLSPILGPFLRKMLGTRAHLALRESILREIDLAETQAFALETTNVCGMVFVNREYARLRGIDETQFVQSVTAEIREKLQIFAKEIGLKAETFTSEGLYEGEFSMLAPELLFNLDDFAVSISYRLAPEVYGHRLHNPMMTGTHRQDGILVGHGPKIVEGITLPSLDILDIAPTVYQLLGEPVPAGLDGRVASEILLPEHRQVTFTGELKSESVGMDVGGYDSIEEAEEMRRRLRELGYLD